MVEGKLNLKELIETYMSRVKLAQSLKEYIANEVLNKETPDFIMNILDNSGLTTDEKYDILKEFEG